MEDVISRNVNSMVALASFKVGNELLPLIASLCVGINNISNLKITTLHCFEDQSSDELDLY